MEGGRRGPGSHDGSKVCAEAQGWWWGLWHEATEAASVLLGSGQQFPGAFCSGSLALACILGPRLWKETFFLSWGLKNEVG